MPPTLDDIDPEEPRVPRGRPPNATFVELGAISNKLTFVAATVDGMKADLAASLASGKDLEQRVRVNELEIERLKAALNAKSDAGKWIVGFLSGVPATVLAVLNIYLLMKGH